MWYCCYCCYCCAEPLFNAALLSFKLGDFQQSFDQASKAIALYPDHNESQVCAFRSLCLSYACPRVCACACAVHGSGLRTSRARALSVACPRVRCNMLLTAHYGLPPLLTQELLKQLKSHFALL